MEVQQLVRERGERQHRNKQPQHEQQQPSMTIAKGEPDSPRTSAVRSSNSRVSSLNMIPPLLTLSAKLARNVQRVCEKSATKEHLGSACDMRIDIDDNAQLDEARTLLREYAAGLPAAVEIPEFEDEVADLPGAYAPPRGRLLVARGDGSAAGCVGLRPFDEEIAELKRLYVREAFRGRGFARALVAAVISAARDEGYRRLRLDTHESMAAARALYGSFGFREIPAYWDHPVPDVRFYELTLE
jgi:putative acetyltransferase